MVNDRVLWALVAITAILDVLTTLYGVGVAGFSEQNPFIVMLIDSVGIIPALVGTKIGAILVGYILYRFVGETHRTAIPAGLALVWGVVVVLNTYALLFL